MAFRSNVGACDQRARLSHSWDRDRTLSPQVVADPAARSVCRREGRAHVQALARGPLRLQRRAAAALSRGYPGRDRCRTVRPLDLETDTAAGADRLVRGL